MAVNLESHGLPIGIAYGAPVTVQDQQGQGHGQQSAQDAGYSNTSAFERAAAGAPQAAVEDQEAGGGDLLSKLSGFIRAVGDVVIDLGEYIRSAGGALSDNLTGQGAAQTPAQTPAAPEAQTPAPAAPTQAQAQTPAPALGTPTGAPVPTAPGAPQVLAAPAQLATAAVLPSQPRPALSTRSSEPAPRDAAKVATTSLGEAPATPSAVTAGPRGGGRASQSSGFPVLNPLPPYLGDQMAFIDFGAEPEAQVQPSLETQPTAEAQLPAPVEQAVAAQAAQETGFTNNVIPFPGPAARDALNGEASNDVTGQAQPEADPASLRYSAVVFRPAFYGNLRC